MADMLSIDLDMTPFQDAVRQLDAALTWRIDDACRVTAQAVAGEAQARLARALKGTSVAHGQRGDLGQNLTVKGIHAQPAHDGNGWVVLSDREPHPNVTLYLEKGTRPGKRRNFARTDAEPYFYPALALEAGNHEQRILDAMSGAADESGLGG